MNNRKIAIIVSGFVVLVILLIVLNAVFSIRHIYPYTNNIKEQQEFNQKILDSEVVKLRGSMFFNTDSAKSKLEKKFDNIVIDSIEKQFPNTVYINYSIKFATVQLLANDKFYSVDINGRVMDIQDKPVDNMAIRLFGAVDLDAKIKIGDTIVDNEKINLVNNIIKGFEQSGQAYKDTINSIYSVSLQDYNKDTVYVNTIDNGTTYIIKNKDRAQEKINKAFELYNTSDDYKVGIIYDTSSSTSIEFKHRSRTVNEYYNEGESDWL